MAVQDEGWGQVLREFRAEDTHSPERKAWLIELADARGQQWPQVALATTPEGIEGIEEGEARAWYFVAPAELLGNWTVAYGGKRT